MLVCASVSAAMRPAILLRMSVPPLPPPPPPPPPPPSGQEWMEQQRSRIEWEEAELAAEEAGLAAFWAAEPPRRLALVGPAGPFCEECGSRVPHEQTRAKLTIRWEPYMPAWIQGRRVYNCSCGHGGEYAAPPLARPGFAALETTNRSVTVAEATTNGGGGGAATSEETRDSDDAAAAGGSSAWTYDWLVPPGRDLASPEHGET